MIKNHIKNNFKYFFKKVLTNKIWYGKLNKYFWKTKVDGFVFFNFKKLK
jgi:hypothetical protein